MFDKKQTDANAKPYYTIRLPRVAGSSNEATHLAKNISTVLTSDSLVFLNGNHTVSVSQNFVDTLLDELKIRASGAKLILRGSDELIVCVSQYVYDNGFSHRFFIQSSAPIEEY